MPKYHVEEMEGDGVLVTHIVSADTPTEAVAKATNRSVASHGKDHKWVRVTNEALGQVFKYGWSERPIGRRKRA